MVGVVLEERGRAVHELGEARARVHQVGAHQVLDPRRPLAAGAVLVEFDLEDGVGEARDLALVDVVEGVRHVAVVDVDAVPLLGVAARPASVERVLADEGNVGVDRDADAVVARFLEGRTPVIRANHRLEMVLADELLERVGRGLELLNLLGLLTLALHLLHRLLHLVLAV